ncbi:ABC transporter ATP-binding protein [Catellatospora chokoriensis]|uniref:ABC transporter ATP-binding protein n=1 Tax=Catellatospora chokoriensis TaxID=310353 RepID=A0A8J3K4D9_9ACTN|nr:ATP-binding cassette domain-containing protein [Catellatospora chokoriensis]GIF89299.1 ABC transporter ATP-binding protein [Catellatospora chokoriensis]
MLAIDAVSHFYKKQLALEEISLHLEPGITGLVGVNGAGKTTMLSIASGSLKPTHGLVAVGDHHLYERGSRKAGLRHIGYMPQAFAYHPSFTAHEYVTYLGYLRGQKWAAAWSMARDVLASVGLEGKLRHKMGSLSGGMIRRVGLAQALMGNPEVLLLDEPTTGLDPEQRSAIRNLIAELADAKFVFVSSHIMEDIEALAAKVVVLHEGAILFSNSIQQLRNISPVDNARDAAEAGFLSLVTRARSGVR